MCMCITGTICYLVLSEVLKLMFVNAALDIFFNCAIFLCIALSSPLFARLVLFHNVRTGYVCVRVWLHAYIYM